MEMSLSAPPMDLCLVLWINRKNYSIKAVYDIGKMQFFSTILPENYSERWKKVTSSSPYWQFWKFESALQGGHGSQKQQSLAARLLLSNKTVSREKQSLLRVTASSQENSDVNGSGYNSIESRSREKEAGVVSSLVWFVKSPGTSQKYFEIGGKIRKELLKTKAL